MLGFRFRNVRSFRDEVEFSFEATAMAEPGVPRSVPWREGGTRQLKVLPAAGVFGANASGKSNLLRVLDDMRHMVLDSFRAGDKNSRIPRRPFRLDPSSAGAPSTYEIDLVLDGIRHEYGFVVDDQRVVSEFARNYPRGKAVTIFRREGDAVVLGEKDRAKGRAITEILRSNSLFLSAAAAADHLMALR